MSEFGLQNSLGRSGELPPPDKCDVSNMTRLIDYGNKRAEWLSWYSFRKDDPNNIEGQIIAMTFLDLSYRVLTRPRGDMALGPDIAARSGILSHMLDQGYVANQILAIRRLLDTRKDVFSLRRLLDDIEANRGLITRENFVAYDGKPYDPEGWRSLPLSPLGQIWGIDAPEFFRFLRAKIRHEMFDKLSGVKPANRNRGDRIREEVFAKLRSSLTAAEPDKPVTLSHKFFAHAANMASRQSLTYTGVALKDIEAAHKAIISVERAITDDILFIEVAREVVAMTPLGFFQGLDRVYAHPEAVGQMQSHWDQLEIDRNKWKNAYEAELYA